MSSRLVITAALLAALTLLVSGCGKFDETLERNMQYVSVDLLRGESTVAYERLSAAHATWQASPGPGNLETFKKLYDQYAAIYNEMIIRAGGKITDRLGKFANTMPPPPPGVAVEAAPKAVPESAEPQVAPEQAPPAQEPAKRTRRPKHAETSDAAPAESPAAAPAKPAVTLASAENYVVQSGDTPHLIAKRFNISEKKLLEANAITAPDKLAIGKKLILPKE